MWNPNTPDTEINTKSPFIRYFLPTGGFMSKTVWDGGHEPPDGIIRVGLFHYGSYPGYQIRIIGGDMPVDYATEIK